MQSKLQRKEGIMYLQGAKITLLSVMPDQFQDNEYWLCNVSSSNTFGLLKTSACQKFLWNFRTESNKHTELNLSWRCCQSKCFKPFSTEKLYAKNHGEKNCKLTNLHLLLMRKINLKINNAITAYHNYLLHYSSLDSTSSRVLTHLTSMEIRLFLPNLHRERSFLLKQCFSC